MGLAFKGHRVSILQNEDFWKWMVVMDAQQFNTTEQYT